MRNISWILTAGLLLTGALQGGEGTGFSVLKVAVPDSTEFVAVPAKDLKARKDAILKSAKDEHVKWETAREAFLKNKDNRNKEYLELEPEIPAVSTAKEGFPDETEAKTWAHDATEKARRWALIRITDCDGKKSNEVIEKSKLRARMADLLKEYQKRTDEWDKAMSLQVPGGGGGGPGGHGHGHGGGMLGGGGQAAAPAHPMKPKLEILKDDLLSKEAADKELAALK